MSPADRKIVDQATDLVYRRLIDQQTFKSCLNCANWQIKQEQCLFYRQRPPAQVIVFSCSNGWMADIPF